MDNASNARLEELGSRIVEAGLASASATRAALEHHLESALGLAIHLVLHGAVDEGALADFLAREHHLQRVTADDLAHLERRVFSLLPIEIIYEHGVLPLRFLDAETALVGVVDPTEPERLEEVAFFAGVAIELRVLSLGEMSELFAARAGRAWKLTPAHLADARERHRGGGGPVDAEQLARLFDRLVDSGHDHDADDGDTGAFEIVVESADRDDERTSVIDVLDPDATQFGVGGESGGRSTRRVSVEDRAVLGNEASAPPWSDGPPAPPPEHAHRTMRIAAPRGASPSPPTEPQPKASDEVADEAADEGASERAATEGSTAALPPRGARFDTRTPTGPDPHGLIPTLGRAVQTHHEGLFAPASDLVARSAAASVATRAAFRQAIRGLELATDLDDLAREVTDSLVLCVPNALLLSLRLPRLVVWHAATRRGPGNLAGREFPIEEGSVWHQCSQSVTAYRGRIPPSDPGRRIMGREMGEDSLVAPITMKGRTVALLVIDAGYEPGLPGLRGQWDGLQRALSDAFRRVILHRKRTQTRP